MYLLYFEYIVVTQWTRLFKMITKDGGFNFENFDLLHDIIIYFFPSCELENYLISNINCSLSI